MLCSTNEKGAKKDWLTRYEAKYIIPHSLVPKIREFIRPFTKADPHARTNCPPELFNNNPAADTRDFALHYAKEWEALNRFNCESEPMVILGPPRYLPR